jgi:hypothetical protein
MSTRAAGFAIRGADSRLKALLGMASTQVNAVMRFSRIRGGASMARYKIMYEPTKILSSEPERWVLG